MVNINKLKGKIVEKNLSVEELADIIKMHRSTLYRKLKGSGAGISIRDADLMSTALELNYYEVNDIFFSQYVAPDANYVIRR